ncbi:glycosyltransferase family 1 protein [Streptococcus pneumoniae]
MTKVLYYLNSLGSGGVEAYSIHLYRHINKDEIDLDIVTFQQREEFFDQELASLGGKKIPLVYERSRNKWKNRFQAMKFLYRLAKSGEYDIAYFNFDAPASILKYPLICRLAGMKKIVVHSHNASSFNPSFLRKWIDAVGRKLSSLLVTEKLACSEEAALWMFGTTAGVHDIKNGIEVEEFVYNDSTRKQMRAELSISEDTFVLGSIARFHKQKNHVFMLSMFEKLLRVRPNSRLIAVGEGDLKQEMEDLAKELKIADKVLFLGARKDIPQLLQAMDVFVLPSLYEGLGIVAIEAQAAGLKCLLADTVPKEAKITNHATFLPLKEEAWVEALADFKTYERCDMRQAIREAGYDSRYSVGMVEEILKQIAQ